MSLYRSFAFSVFDHINTLLTFICSQLQSGVLTQTNQKCKTCGSKLWLQHTFATETWEVLRQDTAKLSGAARERLSQVISIFLFERTIGLSFTQFEALLQMLHLVLGKRSGHEFDGRLGSPCVAQRSRDHNSAVVRLSC